MDLIRRNVVPSTVVNDGSQGALLVITVGLGLSYMLLFLGTRVLIRWPWSILWGKDDTCVAVATVRTMKPTGNQQRERNSTDQATSSSA